MRKIYFALAQLNFPQNEDWLEYEHGQERNASVIKLESDGHIRNLDELRIYNSIMQPNIKCLDIGCGCGGTIACLAEKNSQGLFFGIEPSDIRINFAKKNFGHYKNVCYSQDIIENIEFEENYFDFIIANHVIEHCKNPILLIEKAKKWLKPNGYLVLGSPNVNCFILKIINLYNWRNSHYSHFWLPGKKSLFHILKNEGFKIEKYFTFGGFPAPRNFVKEILNRLFKIFKVGDNIVILAKRKTNE